jgi:hypothetical protein
MRKTAIVIEVLVWLLLTVFLVSSYRALNTEPASGPGAVGFLIHFPDVPRVREYRDGSHG